MLDEENIIEKSSEELNWFAMRATFGRELKAKKLLEGMQIECFIPMRYELVTYSTGKKVKKLVPAISNLMFVHTTKECIQTIKSTVEYLQYLTKPDDGRRKPITIPENQMQHFMKVCDTYNDKLVYMTADEIQLKEGTPVQIIGGTFDGVEGTFVKVEKKRKKQVVIQAQGIAAVMITHLDDGYLKVIS